ncbi:MAG: tRNA (5-methylaminomethyl-2-thiouridine)(34)-methyltransferase MnmD [Hyphomonadaceae bacterium]
MTRLPPLPRLSWTDDGIPKSEDAGDIYFSGDGLAEARAVFLAPCGLPERWRDRARFTVGELGFGSGLNILALWDEWRRSRPSPRARLDVVSYEGWLMPPEAAARVHARHPELAELSARLLSCWPDRARGAQRIDLGDGLRLTLHVDDIARALPETEASVDAWFLDGFAPAKNPDMWSPETMAQLARLSAPGARVGTYSAAGAVRRALADAGFAVSKVPGHGRKRERIEAVTPEDKTAPRGDFAGPRRVLVIGAGIAGACVARAFLARGCEVDILEAGKTPGWGASGNPLGLVMPRLDAGDTPAARGLLEAYLFARRLYRTLPDAARASLDVRHLPRGETEAKRFAKLAADPPLDENLLTFASAEPTELRHLGALAVKPALLLPALIEGARLHAEARVAALSADENGVEAVLDGGARFRADLAIVCAGWETPWIEGVSAPDIEPRLGQVERIAGAGAPHAIADGGYAVEALGDLVFGATFEALENAAPEVSDAARAENLEVLKRLRPDIDADAQAPVSRAGVRATTQDRLPFAGLADDPRIALLSGLGARGFLWAPLLAEQIASAVCGEPWAMERSVADALDPDRFRKRALRKAGDRGQTT